MADFASVKTKYSLRPMM